MCASDRTPVSDSVHCSGTLERACSFRAVVSDYSPYSAMTFADVLYVLIADQMPRALIAVLTGGALHVAEHEPINDSVSYARVPKPHAHITRTPQKRVCGLAQVGT